MTRRVYAKKGAAALAAKITIPITVGTDEQLRQAADRRKVTPTELGRNFLLIGLATLEG